ncbi:MAG: glycosyltransferase [Cyanobacteria bacterium P01_D01_bin.123]
MKKRLMFYCQHILGIGHLVRSMEIVRALTPDFEVCFVNGGKEVPGFEVPESVRVVNLPAIETDPEFQTLRAVDDGITLAEVETKRRTILLAVLDLFRPDALMVELYPFGRRRFSFELEPLLERARDLGTKVSCSLRDIVVTKQDRARHEAKVVKLMNRYFDQLLVHGDRRFVPLEDSFSRTSDLNCPVHYTGYVIQKPNPAFTVQCDEPIILASVGGGRFGHSLLDCIARTAPLLADRIPHTIRMFAGPFVPDSVWHHLQNLTADRANIVIERYTPHLLDYMRQADLSISMAGYNTTMNVLATGVRAMMMPFTGNGDREQWLRLQKLDRMGIVNAIQPEELVPEVFAEAIETCLRTKPTSASFDLAGAANTAAYLRQLVECETPALAVA